MTSWVWAGIFLAATVIMFLVVPRHQMADFLLFGIGAGMAVAFATMYLLVSIMGYWRFSPADFLTFSGIPLLLVMALVPIEMMFAWAITKGEGFMPYVVLMTFPLGLTLVHYWLQVTGNLAYTRWNLSLTFLLTLAIHVALGAYLLAYVRKPARGKA